MSELIVNFRNKLVGYFISERRLYEPDIHVINENGCNIKVRRSYYRVFSRNFSFFKGSIFMLLRIVDAIFAFSLFVNAMLFLPQAYKIFKEKSSKGVSIFTFLGFCLLQLAAIVYGYFHNDKILFLGYFISFMACSMVVILSLKYKNK